LSSCSIANSPFSDRLFGKVGLAADGWYVRQTIGNAEVSIDSGKRQPPYSQVSAWSPAFSTMPRCSCGLKVETHDRT
jgi:hypothetical protein